MEEETVEFEDVSGQDRIKNGLLKSKRGIYQTIDGNCNVSLKNGESYYLSIDQPRIDEGLLRIFGEGDNYSEFVPIADIEKIVYDDEHSFDDSDSDNSCFVATAVYGNPNSHQVNTLRKIRDEVLMRNPVGKKFVDWYYSGNGKKTADFIKEKAPFLISPIRAGLEFIVGAYEDKGSF